MLRYLILGLLRNGKAKHGYALAKEYEARSGMHQSASSFYRELQRLQAEGLIWKADEAKERARKDTGRSRTSYAISEDGLRIFDDWLADDAILSGLGFETEISMRAAFLSEASPVQTLNILERWRDVLLFAGKSLDRARSAAERRADRSLCVLLGRRMKHLVAELEFVEELSDAMQHATATPTEERSERRGNRVAVARATVNSRR
jgi:DNA-binding PadR family transcriptional regulator